MNILEQTPIKDRLVICDESEAITVNRLRKLKELRNNLLSIATSLPDTDVIQYCDGFLEIIYGIEKEICWIKEEMM